MQIRHWQAAAALTLAAFFTAHVTASPPANAAAVSAPRLKRILDARAPAWLDAHDVPSVAVAYIAEGRIAWTAAYGEQSPGRRATPRTLYNIASLAKPISAEAILRLASAGRIGLDEPMWPHWTDPDVASDPRHRLLTPSIALSHRTGFRNWRRLTGGRLRFEWEPGTRSGYSGEGYDYVARFVERRLGTSFDLLVGEQVLRPARMNSTSYTFQPWFDGRVAVVQGPDRTRRLPDTFSAWSAADNVHATVGDYARFLITAMNEQGLSAPIAAARRRIVVDEASEACTALSIPPSLCPEAIGFGLGWLIVEGENETVMMHDGSDWGERSLAFFVPARRTGVVVFTSGANGAKVIRDVAALLFDDRRFNAFIAAQADR